MCKPSEKPSKPQGLPALSAPVWAKKIKGKLRYFGPWSDPDAAYAKFRREVDYLQNGEKPPEPQPSVGELVKAFLDEKEALLGTGDLAQCE
jgi:hypothetical protein